MIKTIIDLLGFLRGAAPLLTSLVILTLLCILFSKSIRKYATAYYVLFAIPFVLVTIPPVCRLFGVQITSFSTIPVLGEIIRDYIHMGTFGHPLLIIIMFMGALDTKAPYVKKLMSIRKELSIISGFPVFAHSLIRVMNNLPGAFQFFGNRAEYLETTRVASELGAGISSFSFILGVLMLIIFIPLWVTSFDGVRKWMGQAKWKKLQKWSYVLYATLFIHAMAIQVGGMLNPRGGGATRAATEVVATAEPSQPRGERGEGGRGEARERRGDDRESARVAGGEGRGQRGGEAARPASGGRVMPKGFSDFSVSANVKRYIHIFSLILVFGSYLYLRLRKAQRDAGKRARRADALSVK